MKFEEVMKYLMSGAAVSRDVYPQGTSVAKVTVTYNNNPSELFMTIKDGKPCDAWHITPADVTADDWGVIDPKCDDDMDNVPLAPCTDDDCATEETVDATKKNNNVNGEGECNIFTSVEQLRKAAKSSETSPLVMIALSKPGCSVCSNWRENVAPVHKLVPILANYNVDFYESTSSVAYLKVVTDIENKIRKGEVRMPVPDKHFDAPIIALAYVSGAGAGSSLSPDDILTYMSVIAEGPLDRKTPESIDKWLGDIFDHMV